MCIWFRLEFRLRLKLTKSVSVSLHKHSSEVLTEVNKYSRRITHADCTNGCIYPSIHRCHDEADKKKDKKDNASNQLLQHQYNIRLATHKVGEKIPRCFLGFSRAIIILYQRLSQQESIRNNDLHISILLTVTTDCRSFENFSFIVVPCGFKNI